MSDVPTLKELILCLPVEDRKKVLEFVEKTYREVSQCDIPEINAQYYAIEEEIKRCI